MDQDKKKEGVSVKEIEQFAKHHQFELFYVLLFVFASLFTLWFWGSVISIFATGVGGILGALFPDKVSAISIKIYTFFFKQERMTQIVLAIVGLILAIFLAPLIFLVIGLHAGKSMMKRAREMASKRMP